MARFVWKEDAVVSLQLRDNSFVLGQLLKSPYMVFFNTFSATDAWNPDAAQESTPLFFCAVTKQFLKYSPIGKSPKLHPKKFDELPSHWITVFHGSRKVTVWQGTPRERTLLLLSER